jgi:hypothetical protein
VFTPEQYENWIETQRPKQYIKNGVWYEGKTKHEMRVEDWKKIERERESQVNLPKPEKPLTDEQKKKIAETRANISRMLGKG